MQFYKSTYKYGSLILLGVATFLFTACGSFQNSGYNQDGIYGQSNQRDYGQDNRNQSQAVDQTRNQNSSNRNYREYFEPW